VVCVTLFPTFRAGEPFRAPLAVTVLTRINTAGMWRPCANLTRRSAGASAAFQFIDLGRKRLCEMDACALAIDSAYAVLPASSFTRLGAPLKAKYSLYGICA